MGVILMALTFGAVFLAAWAALSALRGGADRRLRVRLAAVRDETETGEKPAALIREKYLRRLAPFERALEDLPGMPRVARLLAQSGRAGPAYRVVLLSLALGVAAAVVTGVLTGKFAFALLAALFVTPIPLARLAIARQKRFARFEEQLPDALDMMSRALRAGTPLMESFKFVADEMHPPIADEFRTTWSHINYGIAMKAAFDDFLERMPCVSLRALTTAVLVQRETGGNLAEILDKIAGVLRARFRFHRRLRTLTAEGRMSAMVLILMPFVLAGVLAITSPSYLPMLTGDPMGRTLIYGALITMGLGILWIRRVIKVRV